MLLAACSEAADFGAASCDEAGCGKGKTNGLYIDNIGIRSH